MRIWVIPPCYTWCAGSPCCPQSTRLLLQRIKSFCCCFCCIKSWLEHSMVPPGPVISFQTLKMMPKILQVAFNWSIVSLTPVHHFPTCHPSITLFTPCKKTLYLDTLTAPQTPWWELPVAFLYLDVAAVLIKTWIWCKREADRWRARTGEPVSPNRASCVFNNHSVLSTWECRATVDPIYRQQPAGRAAHMHYCS